MCRHILQRKHLIFQNLFFRVPKSEFFYDKYLIFPSKQSQPYNEPYPTLPTTAGHRTNAQQPIRHFPKKLQSSAGQNFPKFVLEPVPEQRNPGRK